MKDKILFIFRSLWMPGAGYLMLGERLKFYLTVIAFYSIALAGIILRLYPEFTGFISIFTGSLILHIATLTHAVGQSGKFKPGPTSRVARILLTLTFLLVTGTGYSNSGSLMGFDRLYMSVTVMEPAIKKGEQVLADTWAYHRENPKRGDIILHTFPGQTGLFINRVAAIGGDTIEITDGRIFVNSTADRNDYALPANATGDESLRMDAELVPKNHYFVMGDNRDRSLGDSRFNGPIRREDVIGKITCILFSRDMRRIGKSLQPKR